MELPVWIGTFGAVAALVGAAAPVATADTTEALPSGAQVGPGALSAGGRFVAFAGPADGPDGYAVYRRDRTAGTDTPVSISTTDVLSSGDAGRVSDDGRIVAFVSSADSIVPGDANDDFDVYVRDLAAGTTEAVDVDAGGHPLVTGADLSGLSADGRYVAYQTEQRSDEGDPPSQLYVRDRDTGTSVPASVLADGTLPADGVVQSAMSRDGRHVLFATGNPPYALYWRDLDTGETHYLGSSGAAGLAISGDGAIVAFTTYDGRLLEWSRAAAATNPSAAYRSIAKPDDGTPFAGLYGTGGVSDDGNYLLYSSWPCQEGNPIDNVVYRYDRSRDTSTIVSLAGDGSRLTGYYPTAISGNGAVVALQHGECQGSDAVLRTIDDSTPATVPVDVPAQPGPAPELPTPGPPTPPATTPHVLPFLDGGTFMFFWYGMEHADIMCTNAFNVRRANGVRFTLTAKHCVDGERKDDDQKTNKNVASAQPMNITTTASLRFGSGVDCSPPRSPIQPKSAAPIITGSPFADCILPSDNPKPNNGDMVAFHPDAATTLTARVRVKGGVVLPVVGSKKVSDIGQDQRLCHYGAGSNDAYKAAQQCGPLESTKLSSSGTYTLKAKGIDGDSGGPVYLYKRNKHGKAVGVWAVGLAQTAGSVCPKHRPCYAATTFIPIATVLDRLGVSLLTSR